jgi:nitrilase
MEFKKFKAATVQTSPVFLNVEKTVDKAISFIKEASQNGAQLIAFPEVFIAGYPYWNWIMTPVQGSKWYEELYKNSVAVTDEINETLFQAAKDSIFIL